MLISKEQIKAIAPTCKDSDLTVFTPYLNMFMGDVNTVKRMAAFLANILHESGCFHYVEEIASGASYEGRLDLGNTQSGDGIKFKGRGLIQITGRANYTALSNSFFQDNTLIKNPEILSKPQFAVKSAYWFWYWHKLNDLADNSDFKAIVKKINGGLNGYAERVNYYNKALQILSE